MSKLLPDPTQFKTWQDWAYAYIMAAKELEDEIINFQYQPEIHIIGDTGEPTFEPNWSNFGGTFRTMHFFMDHSGTVFINGVVVSTSAALGQPIFFIPEPYRPKQSNVGLGNANDFHARVDVLAHNGEVKFVATAGGDVTVYLAVDAKYSIHAR